MRDARSMVVLFILHALPRPLIGSLLVFLWWLYVGAQKLRSAPSGLQCHGADF